MDLDVMSTSSTMERPQHSRKRTWQQSQQECTDSKLIEAKRILRASRSRPGSLVIIHNQTEKEFAKLHATAMSHNLPVKLERVKTAIKCDTATWNLSLGGKIVASGEYVSERPARDALSRIALDELRRYCFTVIKKRRFRDTLGKDGSVQEVKAEPAEISLETLSLVEKMMAKIGWTGDGLGAQQQRIVKTIELQEQINRRGFGADNFVGEVSNILAEYAQSCSIKPLVFPKQYTIDEKRQIYWLTKKNHLKWKCFGSDVNRCIVVYCRFDKWHLVEKLIEEGGETDDYKLIYPTDL